MEEKNAPGAAFFLRHRACNRMRVAAFLRPAGSPGGGDSFEDQSQMRQPTLFAGLSLLALVAGYALPASAQTTRETTTSTERYYMPYEKNFWSNFGISAGSSKFDRSCSG